jgi:hypothetical protein
VLRRAPFPLDEFTFNTGVLVPTSPPAVAGSPDSVVVLGLPEGTLWWFALRVLDDAGNPSAISVADSASLPGEAPARITDLRALSVAESTVVLTWTATGGERRGGPSARLRDLGLAEPDGFEQRRRRAARSPASRHSWMPAGPRPRWSSGSRPGRRWRFAVRAEDHAHALSPISNVLEVVTPVGGALAGKGYLGLAPRPNPAASEVTGGLARRRVVHGPQLPGRYMTPPAGCCAASRSAASRAVPTIGTAGTETLVSSRPASTSSAGERGAPRRFPRGVPR